MAVILIVFGVRIGLEGFVSNIFSELAGFFLGVTITYVVLNNVEQRADTRRWAKIETISLRSLSSHLCDIARGVNNQIIGTRGNPLNSEIQSGYKLPNNNAKQAMEKVVALLHVVKTEQTDVKQLNLLACECYNNLFVNIESLRGVVIPRIIQFVKDQRLVNLLTELDEAALDFQLSCGLYKQGKAVDTFSNIINLTKICTELYGYMSENRN